MKISTCDYCAANGKLNPSGWRLHVKKGFEKVSLDICSTHRAMAKGHTYEHALEILNKASSFLRNGVGL